MDEATEELMAAVRVAVWSGFHTKHEVAEMLTEWLGDDEGEPDEAALIAALQQEFTQKQLAEVGWPIVTDCNRLDQAFEALQAKGVITLQNAGYTISDGLGDVGQVLQEEGRAGIRGYCFYHGQDLERVLEGDGLLLAFGSLDDEPAQKRAVGQLVQAALQEAGLVVDWNGDPETRLQMPLFDWKRRSINK